MKKKVFPIIIFLSIVIVLAAVISALIFTAQNIYWNSLYGFNPTTYDIYRLVIYSLSTLITGSFLIIFITKIILNVFPKLNSALKTKLIKHRRKSEENKRNKKILKYNKLKYELQIHEEHQDDE